MDSIYNGVVPKGVFMRFATYIKTAAVGFLSVANYRTEIWFLIVQRILVLAGLILLWSVIGGASLGKTYSQLIAYFLVANGARELVDAQYGKFGSSTIDDIKNGAISSFLLQPTHTVPFLFFRHFGTRGVEIVFSIIFIAVGIVLEPPSSVLAVVLFLIVLVISLAISISQSTMVASLAFWVTESKGIKNAVCHVARVFSGSLIPLSFFPVAYKGWVVFNPFASYAYLPTTVIQAGVVDRGLWLQIGAAFLWAVGLILLSQFIWKKGIKNYEAIGL